VLSSIRPARARKIRFSGRSHGTAFSRDLDGAQPRGVVEHIGDHDQFIGAGLGDQGVDPRPYRLRTANDGVLEHLLRLGLLRG